MTCLTLSLGQSRQYQSSIFRLLKFLLILLLAATTFEKTQSIEIPSEEGAVVTGRRIIGGSEASPGEIPYIVTLQAYNYVGGRYLTCGGSIINSFHIITAAHCVYNQNVRNLEVVAGTHSIYTEEMTEQRRDVETVSIHPSYDPWTLDGDIAIIRLSRPFVLDEFIQPIQLPPKGIEPSGECLNSGFGNVLNNGSTYFPGILHKVSLNVLPRSRCRELYSSPITPITPGMICASVEEGGKGACHGDSGGPFVCRNDSSGELYLAGSVSWGMRICALPNEPSVYANLGYYREFIDEVISD